MPELPEVETVRRGLAPALEGHRIERAEARRPDLRFPLPERFADLLAGRRVEALNRRAKYLIAGLDDGSGLIMHLGMSGSFRVERGEAVPGGVAHEMFHYARFRDARHDHVVLHLDDGARIVYNDPRRFGFMTITLLSGIDCHPHFAGL